MKRGASGAAGVQGFTLLEVLIALVILAFGLLALARAQTQSALTEMEALQRSQALALTQNMVDRINLNRKNAALYVGNYAGNSNAVDCSAQPNQAATDGCEWQNLLGGTSTLDGTSLIGAPIAVRGCITTSAANMYVVAVAWQGLIPTAAPQSACGLNAFDQEPNRRTVSTVVQIATLGAP